METFYIDNVKCFHVFYYTQKVQELLYQYKGCKDYELKTIFLEYFKNHFNIMLIGYIMVPAPSTKESDEERGFNHVEEMFKSLNLKMIKCLHKTKQVKQADLTTKEREKIGDYLVIDDGDLEDPETFIYEY